MSGPQNGADGRFMERIAHPPSPLEWCMGDTMYTRYQSRPFLLAWVLTQQLVNRRGKLLAVVQVVKWTMLYTTHEQYLMCLLSSLNRVV